MKHLCLPLLFLAVTFASRAQPTDNFWKQVEKKARIYQEVASEGGEELAMRGKLIDATARLESVVPDSLKEPADYFILGNMLYDLDSNKSFIYHKRAYDAFPEHLLTKYEMAYEYHRRQMFDKALPLYEELARDTNLKVATASLLAHCYIHQKRYNEAVQAWKAAEVNKRHTRIDVTVHEVFGNLSPYARQSNLINDVRNGHKEKLRELLLLGVEWETDWWNRNPNWRALAIDIETIDEAFGKQSVEATEARLLIDAMKGADSSDKQAVESLLQRSGFIVNQRLPSSTFIARRLIALVTDNEIRTTQQLEEELGPELMKRVHQHDKDALDIMASLYESNENQKELSNIDSIGWHEFHDPTYALSYLHGLQQNQRPLKDELASAIAEFPDDSRILFMFYDHTKDEKASERVELLARVIEKEYFGLRNDPSRYGYALRNFYLELTNLIH